MTPKRKSAKTRTKKRPAQAAAEASTPQPVDCDVCLDWGTAPCLACEQTGIGYVSDDEDHDGENPDLSGINFPCDQCKGRRRVDCPGCGNPVGLTFTADDVRQWVEENGRDWWLSSDEPPEPD
jgi:hypothetical protein